MAYRDEILSDGQENDDDQQNSKSKGRVVSSRVILPVKIQILPKINIERSFLSTVDSTINIDVLTTMEVGSTILQLGMNNRMNLNQTQWFIMVGHILYTRYFHVDFQTGQLILLRPVTELMNQTNPVELRVNVTTDWINMNTIKVKIKSVEKVMLLIEIFSFEISVGDRSSRSTSNTVDRIFSDRLFQFDFEKYSDRC